MLISHETWRHEAKKSFELTSITWVGRLLATLCEVLPVFQRRSTPFRMKPLDRSAELP